MYPTLFQAGDTEGNGIESANFGKKWGFYQNFYALAKGDITKFDEVSRIDIHTCLTYLSFEKEKNKIERALIKKAYKK